MGLVSLKIHVSFIFRNGKIIIRQHRIRKEQKVEVTPGLCVLTTKMSTID